MTDYIKCFFNYRPIRKNKGTYAVGFKIKYTCMYLHYFKIQFHLNVEYFASRVLKGLKSNFSRLSLATVS